MNAARLACPDCHGTRFSWIAREVKFGQVREYDSGIVEETQKSGDYLDDDTEEKGVFCVGCGEHKDQDELIPTALSVAAQTLQDRGNLSDADRDIAIEHAAHYLEVNSDLDPVRVITHALEDKHVPEEEREAVREALESTEVAA